jgi:hypothetical protein
MNPDSVLAALPADDPSLNEVLKGFINRVGGASVFGEKVADMFVDGETGQTQRVAIANTVMKLLGQFGEGGQEDEITNDMILKRIEELDRQIERSEEEAE